MKKFIVILTSLLVGLCAFSQEGTYKKMLVNGRTWKLVTLSSYDYDKRVYLDTTYWERTLVGPISFQGESCFHFKEKPNIYVKEVDGKVYSYGADEYDMRGWRLEIDFNANVGDKLYIYKDLETPFYISSVDSVEIRGVIRKRLQENFTSYWIEGIGNTESGPFLILTRPTHLHEIRLLSVYDGEECIFSEDDLKDVSYIHNVEHRNGQEEHVYDLKGLPVEAPLQKGIYIKKGKKYVVWQ